MLLRMSSQQNILHVMVILTFLISILLYKRYSDSQVRHENMYKYHHMSKGDTSKHSLPAPPERKSLTDSFKQIRDMNKRKQQGQGVRTMFQNIPLSCPKSAEGYITKKTEEKALYFHSKQQNKEHNLTYKPFSSNQKLLSVIREKFRSRLPADVEKSQDGTYYRFNKDHVSNYRHNVKIEHHGGSGRDSRFQFTIHENFGVDKTRGGSSFKTIVNGVPEHCYITDLLNGRYVGCCDVHQACATVSISLMFTNFTAAVQDTLTGLAAIDRNIYSQTVCKDNPNVKHA